MEKRAKYTILDPKTQEEVVKYYQRGQRGHGLQATAKHFNIPKPTVQHIIQRAERNRGGPFTPRGHRKRKLSEVEEGKIRSALDRNPFLTNSQLAKKVGKKIKPRTVSLVLSRSSPRFSRKKATFQSPNEFTPQYKEVMRNFVEKKLRGIPVKNRVYEDETGIPLGLAPNYGRSRVGKKIRKPNLYKGGKKYTLHVFADSSRVVYWELRKKNATDEECVAVCQKAVNNFKRGQTLLWDRLGKSGRKAVPDKQHFNPDIIAMFNKKGVKVVHLPPMAKYIQPLEALFGHLKETVIRANFAVTQRSLTKGELEEKIGHYMENIAPTLLGTLFAEYANGKNAKKNKIF